jgi:carbon storage regulator CsrA
MLVLTRKPQQQIQLGNDIRITIVRIKGQTVRVGIEAPKSLRVLRSELAEAPAPEAAVLNGDLTELPAEAAACQAGVPAAVPSAATAAIADVPRCRASSSPRQPGETGLHQPPIDVQRRIPGASLAPPIRRPQRLGPASLRSMRSMRRCGV